MSTVLTLISHPKSVRMDEAIVRDLAMLIEQRHGVKTRCEMLGFWEAWDVFLETDDVVDIATTVKEMIGTLEIDTIFQPTAGRRKKLLISDMDSTMINQECIDEIADYMGLKAEIAAITDRAMNGELDFAASLQARVKLLAGLAEGVLLQAFQEKITYMNGAKTLVQTMKKHGAYSVLVSGGFTFFAARVAAGLGFDHYEANVLHIEGGKLTGTVQHPILDKDSKKLCLEKESAKHGIALKETLAVGDGANDLPMLLAAGLGIAYHAKPHVRAQAKSQVLHNDLTALLYAQGYKKEEWTDRY